MTTPDMAAPPRPDDFLNWVHLYARPMNPSDETALVDVLRLLFPHARSLRVEGLTQGWSRAAYCVDVDGRVMFAKHLPADASERERVDFLHHAAVSQWAAEHNLAPAILGYNAATQTMLTPFVAQGAATPHMVATFDPAIASVLRKLKRFHDTAAPAALLQRAPTQMARLDANILRLQQYPSFPSERLSQVEQLRSVLGQRLQASMELPVLCHNDFNPYNALSDGLDAWLIDFEWASRGDPMADVARLACSGDLEPLQLPAWLALYDSAADASMVFRLSLWVLAVDLERYTDASLNGNEALATYCLARRVKNAGEPREYIFCNQGRPALQRQALRRLRVVRSCSTGATSSTSTHAPTVGGASRTTSIKTWVGTCRSFANRRTIPASGAPNRVGLR